MTQTRPKVDQGELPGGGNSWGDSLKIGLSPVMKGAMEFKRGPCVNRVKEAKMPCLFSSVQLHLTLCNSMNLSMPGLLVHHQLLEFPQTHEH